MLTFRIIHNLTKGGVTTVYYELMPFPTIELYSDNKDDLYYDPDHCYSLLNNWYASVNYSKESKNLIRQYPSIFSSFYSYKSPDESVKRKLFFFYLYYNKDNTYFNDFLIKVKNKYFMISNKKFMYSDLVNVDLDNIDLKQFNSLKEVFIRLKLDENLISNKDSITPRLNSLINELSKKKINYSFIHPLPDCVPNQNTFKIPKSFIVF